jgi:hypothetical protein
MMVRDVLGKQDDAPGGKDYFWKTTLLSAKVGDHCQGGKGTSNFVSHYNWGDLPTRELAVRSYNGDGRIQRERGVGGIRRSESQ